MKGQIEIDLNKLPINSKGLPVVWIDRVMFHFRDQIATLRLFSAIPDELVEVGRFQLGNDLLKKTVDIIVRAIDYYPEKPTAKSPDPRTNADRYPPA